MFGKKKFLVAVLLVICLMFTACGGSGEPAGEGGETVKIGLLSIDDSLPFFVAQEKGFFEEAGVSVELVPFGSAKDKEMALEAGALDGDMTDLIVTALLKKTTDVKVVSYALGANASEGRFVLLTAPNSGIETMEDLKGVPVAIGNNTIIHYICDRLQTMNGFTAEEKLTQNIPDLGLRLEALMAGKDVQAAILPDPLAALAEMQGAKTLVDDTLLDENLSQSVVIFTQEAIDKKGEEIQKVMDAYFRAMTYLNENQDTEEVKAWHMEFCKIPEVLQDTYSTSTYTPNALPDEEMIRSVVDWMVEEGLLEEAYAYEDLVYDGFVKEN
ncbi:MAG: metal ABC transporter substrate-binding protein [Clostridiales bacterium]|nr:metal ABC transporter substrate-binding protein [Clostridiales bacterium]